MAHIASYRPFCTRMAVCQAGLPVGPRAGFRRMSPCILYEVGEPLVKSHMLFSPQYFVVLKYSIIEPIS